MRPQRAMKKIQAKPQPLTEKIQNGKTGREGASEDVYPKMGGMPASGNFQKNAGGPPNKGGSSTTGAMKGEGGTSSSSSHAKEGPRPTHEAVKDPKHPGSHGGPHTGSIDTLTKLFFHPKGGFGNKKDPDTSKRPPYSGGYKDSGPKSGRRITGVSH